MADVQMMDLNILEWVISRGKTTYYQAKENPDNLIHEVSEDQEEYEAVY